MTLALHWYESTTFVGIAGLVISVFTAAGTTVAAYRFARPKRLVLVDMPQPGIPLLKAPSSYWPDSFTVEPGKDLSNVSVVKLQFRSKGRWDIATNAFDQDMPITIDLGVPILSMKRVQPMGVPFLRADFSETELRIGPGLVRQRRKWEFVLLTEAPTARFTFTNPLVDVDVLRNTQQRSRRWKSIVLLLVAYVIISLLLYRLKLLMPLGNAIATFVNSL